MEHQLLFVGGAALPPPQTRQPLPVIAEPTYAEVVGPPRRPPAVTAPPTQPRALRTQPTPTQQQKVPAEARTGGDSTEQLLLSSSPPSESLFPFAPTHPGPD